MFLIEAFRRFGIPHQIRLERVGPYVTDVIIMAFYQLRGREEVSRLSHTQKIGVEHFPPALPIFILDILF